MPTPRQLRTERRRAQRRRTLLGLGADVGVAMTVAAALASGVLTAGVATSGVATPGDLTAGSSDVQSYAAGAGFSSAALSTQTYSASTMAEIAAAQRALRIAAIRAAVAAGEPFGLEDLPAAQTGPAVAALGWAWPVTGGWISDTFGTRGGAHAGIDIAAAEGTPVTAAAPGIVVLSEESHHGYGVAIMIEHADGVRTLYGHLVAGSRAVEAGDWVEAGDRIGDVGNTGRSFGAHLHLEVRVGEEAVDPLTYLP